MGQHRTNLVSILKERGMIDKNNYSFLDRIKLAYKLFVQLKA